MSRFLAHYEAYVAKITDAPTEFGHATGLAILSAIALRRRWLNRGTGIYPNLFMLLTADSSKDRKSTSVKLGLDLLREVDPKRIGPTDFTPEGLMTVMRKKPGKLPRNCLLLPMSEFGNFLATTNTYAAGNSSFLCQLYDGETIERSRAGKKPSLIINPRVSLLGAVAHGMLIEYAKKEDWTTGFFARFLFVTPGPVRPPRMDSPPPRNPQDIMAAKVALMLLKDELEKSAAGGGAMGVSALAESLYKQFAMGFDVAAQDDNVFAPARERLLNACWKLAMLYQIDLDPNADISGLAMEKAIIFCRKSWDSFGKVYGRAGGSERSRFAMKLWRRLWTDGGQEGLQKRALYRACHMRLEDFKPAIEELRSLSAVVDVVIDGKPGLKAVEAPPESGE